MDNEKKKHTKRVMAILSVIIIVLGMTAATGVYYELSNQINSQSSGLYIDGSDVSGIVALIGNAGVLVISVLIVLASFFAVGLQWLSYFVVNLIKEAINGKKQQNMYMNNNYNAFENDNNSYTNNNNFPGYNPFENNNNNVSNNNPYSDNNNFPYNRY